MGESSPGSIGKNQNWPGNSLGFGLKAGKLEAGVLFIIQGKTNKRIRMWELSSGSKEGIN